MVRLRVLFGAMLASSLMGLGLGVELGKREQSSTSADGGESVASPACSVPVLPCVPCPIPTSSVRTLRIPRFKNRIEYDFLSQGKACARDLTEAVVQAIEKRTDYKVVQSNDADRELSCVITEFNQRCPDANQMHGSGIQEVQTILVADVSWRDRRSGKSLLPLKGKKRPIKCTLQSVGYYRPEINEAINGARKQNVTSMTEQILALLETGL